MHLRDLPQLGRQGTGTDPRSHLTYSAAVRLAWPNGDLYAQQAEQDSYRFRGHRTGGVDGVKMMLVNYPNMPTGRTPTSDAAKVVVSVLNTAF